MCLWDTSAPDNRQFQRWPKYQGQISWYHQKYLVTRNAHMHYKSYNMLWPMSIQNRSNVKVKRFRNNRKEYSCELWKLWSRTHCWKVIDKVQVFKKVGQTRSRSQRKNCLDPRNGLVLMNINSSKIWVTITHWKTSYCEITKLLASLTIINVKVLNEWIKPQDQGHNVKNVGTHEKVLSQGIPMRNIKAL